MRLCTVCPCATKRGRAETEFFDQQNETSGESRRFRCHTELQLKSLEKILIARRARSSYETCFVISFLIIQRTGMTIHIESTKTNTGTRKIPMTEDVYRCF